MLKQMTWLVATMPLLMQLAPAYGMELKNNPFEQPALKESGKNARQMAVKKKGPVMSLRGTMAAGAFSLANIGGEILGIGEQVNGYRLVAVHPRHVVLEKNEIRKTLSIDNETEKVQ